MGIRIHLVLVESFLWRCSGTIASTSHTHCIRKKATEKATEKATVFETLTFFLKNASSADAKNVSVCDVSVLCAHPLAHKTLTSNAYILCFVTF